MLPNNGSYGYSHWESMPNRVDVEVRTGQLPKFKREVLDQLVTKLGARLEVEAVRTVQDSIRSVGAVASGQLLESVTATVTKNRTRDLLINVGSDDRAAEYIESGLPPNIPVTVDRVYEWMQQRGIPEVSRWDAYYVARKLYFDGYEARQPFALAEEKLAERMDDIINEVLNSEGF